MAQAMTERCYRTEGLPQGIGGCIRALPRRRRSLAGDCRKIAAAQKDAQKLGGESVKGAALSPFRVQ